MLFLNRKRQQSICISDSIVVTVLGFRCDRVKLGVEAPAGVTVRRQEKRKADDSTDVPERAE